jgi:hypothetical protein
MTIDPRDGKETVDSLLRLVHYSDTPNFSSAFSTMDNVSGSGVAFLHIYSNFEWLRNDSSRFIYCDTLVAHLVFSDSAKIKELTQFRDSLDTILNKRDFHYDNLIVVPNQIFVKNKGVKKTGG